MRQVLQNLTPYGTIRKQINDNFEELYNNSGSGVTKDTYTIDISDGIDVNTFNELKQSLIDEKVIIVKNNGNSYVCSNTIMGQDGEDTSKFNIYLQYINNISDSEINGVQESLSLINGQSVVEHITTQLDFAGFNGKLTLMHTNNNLFPLDNDTYNRVVEGIQKGMHFNVLWSTQVMPPFTLIDIDNIIETDNIAVYDIEGFKTIKGLVAKIPIEYSLSSIKYQILYWYNSAEYSGLNLAQNISSLYAYDSITLKIYKNDDEYTIADEDQAKALISSFESYNISNIRVNIDTLETILIDSVKFETYFLPQTNDTVYKLYLTGTINKTKDEIKYNTNKQFTIKLNYNDITRKYTWNIELNERLYMSLSNAIQYIENNFLSIIDNKVKINIYVDTVDIEGVNINILSNIRVNTIQITDSIILYFDIQDDTNIYNVVYKFTLADSTVIQTKTVNKHTLVAI